MNEEMKKFEKLLKEVVEKRISGEVLIETVTKVGECYEGLSIKVPNETMVPIIRLEPYAEMARCGLSIDDIANRVIADYEALHKCRPDLNPALLSNFSQMKSKILPSLINAATNMELLKTVPHRVLHDLAITYRIVISSDEESTQSAIITKNIMKIMGVSEDDLYEAAKENLAAAEIQYSSMEEIFGRSLGFETFTILRVKNYYYGASAILDSKTLTKIYKKVGSFTIVPSSVSEVLTIPGVMSADDMNQMIKSVNATLEPSLILSDHAYAVVGSTEGLRIISLN